MQITIKQLILEGYSYDEIVKNIIEESATLLMPALAPYMYNSYNHAKVDIISNKKELDLYKKNNPNYKNYDSIGKLTKVGAGVGLASGGVLNGAMAYHNNKFGEEFDPAMGAFFMATPTLLGTIGGLVTGGINKLDSENNLTQKLKRKELELQSKNKIQR